MVGRMRGGLQRPHIDFKWMLLTTTQEGKTKWFQSILYWLGTLIYAHQQASLDPNGAHPHSQCNCKLATHKVCGLCPLYGHKRWLIHLGVGGAIKRAKDWCFYLSNFPFLYHSLSSYVSFRFGFFTVRLLKKNSSHMPKIIHLECFVLLSKVEVFIVDHVHLIAPVRYV